MHSIRLANRGNPDEFVSELVLCKNDEQKLSSNFSCVLLGVPFDMAFDEFETFIEPFKPECESYELILEDQSIYVSVVEARCKIAIISFYNESSYDTFCSLYNNLHFPSYRSNPPCLVLPITIEKTVYGASLKENELNVAKCDSHEKVVDVPTITAIASSSFSSATISSSNRKRRLPLCTVCLRRIKASVSRISGSNDIPVHTKFSGNGARCLVCRIYGGTQSVENEEAKRGGDRKISSSSSGNDNSSSNSNITTDVTKLRRCLTCDLRDNVWVCMICAHTGCGRYTCQHAQHHFEQSGHPFSLELASGRIWDYDHDTFVHVERGMSINLLFLY